MFRISLVSVLDITAYRTMSVYGASTLKAAAIPTQRRREGLRSPGAAPPPA